MVFILILPFCLFRHSFVCCTLPSRTVRGCYSQNVRLLHTLQTEMFNLHHVAVWVDSAGSALCSTQSASLSSDLNANRRSVWCGITQHLGVESLFLETFEFWRLFIFEPNSEQTYLFAVPVQRLHPPNSNLDARYQGDGTDHKALIFPRPVIGWKSQGARPVKCVIQL